MVLAFASLASAAFPYTLVETAPGGATFEYPCASNNECFEPGDLYCGACGTQAMQCIEDRMCKVTCKEVAYPLGADEWWEDTKVSLSPEQKRAGQPVEITITDSRDGAPLLARARIYLAVGQVEELVDMIHVARYKWATGGVSYNGQWLALPIQAAQTRMERGELIANRTTDCWGRMSVTPQTAGYYVIRATGKDFAFLVGDEGGNTFTCKNGVCESALGETVGFCPEDCGAQQPAPAPQPPAANNTAALPPAAPAVQQPQAKGGADNTALVIALVAALAAAIAAVFILVRKRRSVPGQSQPAGPAQ